MGHSVPWQKTTALPGYCSRTPFGESRMKNKPYLREPCMQYAPMKTLHTLLWLAFATAFAACQSGQSAKTRYNYETVPGDPLGTMIYTLDNGLKVYLSVNKKEPRVVTQIAVRTGSRQDPADATGLAHYLEHMLFKGTSKVGTKDWEKERVYLQQISDLYETHRAETDMAKRKRIYAQIDSVSGIAAQYAIANEYDKMVSSLGAKGTNAYTSNEKTVYINDIPANELEKWAKLESERMRELVLRLFHTELEVVYEEFNRGEDSDQRRAFFSMLDALFPTHPYGQQTTIGTSEHLKNPSMVKIHQYFKERYQPNNMAIVLSGDIDPDKAVDLIIKYFGDYKAGEVPKSEPIAEAPITSPIVRDITGVESEFVMVAYRMPGIADAEMHKLKIINGLLSNGQAGLIDLELVQKQKIISGYSFNFALKDYSTFVLNGVPRSGQDLNEVADLLRSQVERIQNGDFEDWMVQAVVKDMKLNELRGSESNWSRAGKMVDAFIYQLPWKSVVGEFEAMEKVTKEDMVAFAKKWFGENYVQINKRFGENTAVKVEKPIITPVPIDRDSRSEWFATWDSIPSGRLSPQFIDYNTAIVRTNLGNGIDLHGVRNENNDLFDLYYILDMGTDHDKLMALAVQYLPYLGTSRYSAEELKKEFFKLGLSFDVFSSRDRIYVNLSGLNESLEPGMELFEHILADVQHDPRALQDMVAGILKKRQDAMKSKGQILFNGMMNMAQYGPQNPFKNILSEAELKAVSPEQLTEKIKTITSYKHTVFYYGPQQLAAVKPTIEKQHKVPAQLMDYPEPIYFSELETARNQVYFTHFDMVQSEMILVSKGPMFDPTLIPIASLYNEYFGSGLSSIVFQEIRESKALAYSAYSGFSIPQRQDRSHYVTAYIGAQVDKLPEATDAMLELMSNMPRAEIQFESARDAAMKQIESSRTTGASIYWNYQTAKMQGLDYDINSKTYEALQTMDLDAMQAFFDTHIKGNNYTYCVIGNKERMDFNVLSKLGPVKELSLEEIFGYPDLREAQPLVKR
jgi:predicted Zn-dependent peptidase